MRSSTARSLSSFRRRRTACTPLRPSRRSPWGDMRDGRRRLAGVQRAEDAAPRHVDDLTEPPRGLQTRPMLAQEGVDRDTRVPLRFVEGQITAAGLTGGA